MLKNYLLSLTVFLLSVPLAVAEESSMQHGSCPMCGAMGWGGMALGAVLLLSVSAALVALAVFLVRKSRT